MKQLISSLALATLCVGAANAMHHREETVNFGDNSSYRSKASTKRIVMVTDKKITEFAMRIELQEAGGSCTNKAKGWFSVTAASESYDTYTINKFIDKKWFDVGGVQTRNPCRLDFHLEASHDFGKYVNFLWFELYMNPRHTQKFILKDTSTITLKW